MSTKEKNISKLSEELTELVSKFINYKWNCTNSTGIVSKFIRIMGSEFSDLKAMKDFLETEKARMSKDKHSNGFSYYYGTGIIETLDEIMVLAPKLITDKTVLSSDNIVGMRISQAFKNNFSYNKFNWSNFYKLREANIMAAMHDFDSDFRGDITKVHKVHEEKYVIIEAERHPFDYDNQRYKRNEPKEVSFYAFVKTEKGYSHNSSVYRSFEDALFSVICPQYANAMSALLNQSKLEA